jgi:hypothetical protein
VSSFVHSVKLKAVRFEGEDEFEDVQRRATKKLTIGAALTPNKRVKLCKAAAAAASPPTVVCGIAPEERVHLQTVTAQDADTFMVSAQQWNALRSYLTALDTQLPMLQRYVKESRALTEAIVE